LHFSGIRIFPGTLIQAQAVKEGIIEENDSLLNPVYYFSPDIGREKLNNVILEGFEGRMDRIFPPSQGLEMARAMNRHGFYGLLWDRLVYYG